MPYLIDGHNLIPKVGLRLDSVDDEIELIELLQEYSRGSRMAIEVFFDGAPAGQAGSRKFGRVTARFVSQARTADAAIRDRLKQLGGEARNWTVVSSDREVLHAAQAAHARSQTAEDFAAQVRGDSVRRGKTEPGNTRGAGEGGMSEEEIRHWVEVFKKRDG
jgi:predicted RNA-binding protein with PIN domain